MSMDLQLGTGSGWQALSVLSPDLSLLLLLLLVLLLLVLVVLLLLFLLL